MYPCVHRNSKVHLWSCCYFQVSENVSLKKKNQRMKWNRFLITSKSANTDLPTAYVQRSLCQYVKTLASTDWLWFSLTRIRLCPDVKKRPRAFTGLYFQAKLMVATVSLYISFTHRSKYITRNRFIAPPGFSHFTHGAQSQNITTSPLFTLDSSKVGIG